MTRRAPVPERVWNVATLPLLTSGWFQPKIEPLAPLLKSASPSMGEYSLSSFKSATILASALRTTGKTYGLPSSSLYAPTPRLHFFGFLSLLKPIVRPRMASAGAVGTWLN